MYDDLCQLFPKDYSRIDCVRGGKLLSIEDVQSLLWEKVSPLLPVVDKIISTPEVSEDPVKVNIKNPYVSIINDKKSISKHGYDSVLKILLLILKVMSMLFTTISAPVTIVPAMARLSRRADDMRLTILDEFTVASHKDENLLHRVITAYGDDSVQQLVGLHLVVENASNLLTKKLEWGRLASYLEQSTRYIYFDERDDNGNYRYFIPPQLDATTKNYYCEIMDEIFSIYSIVVRELTVYLTTNSKTPKNEQDGPWRSAVKAQACDVARSLLPVATKSTVGIFASGQALESLIMHLQSDPLPEARKIGLELLREGRKVIPTFLERADKPDRGGANVAYLASTNLALSKLAENLLPPNYSTESTQMVTLTDVWPRNEISLVADMLYEKTDLPLEQIRSEISSWDYQKKLKVFDTYIGERLNRRHKPGQALEKAHYSWDIVCDYGIFRDLQRHRMVDDLSWQSLTPRFGFDMPELIEHAGLTELFESGFDLSLQLFSRLQSAGLTIEAQYAVLMGHKMRWKVTYNAREAFHFHELRTSPQGHPQYRKLVREMHSQLARVHPMIAESMRFINQDEDPELSRLAAERYATYKLEKLQNLEQSN